MKKNISVALTALTFLLGATTATFATENKPEKLDHPPMTGDCNNMPEGSKHGMHRGWGKEGHGEWRKESHGRDGQGHLEKMLALTDAQKKTLADQKEKQKAAMESLFEKRKAAHDALRKAADENADDTTLTKLANESAATMAQLEISRIKARKQLVALLTPEQKQKLADLEASHHRQDHP